MGRANSRSTGKREKGVKKKKEKWNLPLISGSRSAEVKQFYSLKVFKPLSSSSFHPSILPYFLSAFPFFCFTFQRFPVFFGSAQQEAADPLRSADAGDTCSGSSKTAGTTTTIVLSVLSFSTLQNKCTSN